MIDLNNQLLDDETSPADLNAALAICEQSHRDGIEEIVVTLRMAKSDGKDSERALSFERNLNELRELLPGEKGINLKLNCGYEWALSDDLPERLSKFNRYPSINESNYLLISFPSLAVQDDYERVLGEVLVMGYAPIISHPECSRAVRRNRSTIGDLINLGCLIQIDALSVIGGYTSEIELFTRELLERGQTHFIASRSGRRNWREPRLTAAYERASKIIGRGSAQCLVRENPMSVLANEPKIDSRRSNRAAQALEPVLNARV